MIAEKVKQSGIQDISLLVQEEWDFKTRMIRLLIIFAIPVSLFHGLTDLRRGETTLAWAAVAFVLIFVVALVFLRRNAGRINKLTYDVLARTFFVMMLVFHLYAIGLGASFAIISQIVMYPFLAILILGRKEGLVWSIVYTAVLAPAALVQVLSGNPVVDEFTLVVSSLSILALVGVDVYVVETVRQSGYRQLLEKHRELSDSNVRLEEARLQAQSASRARSDFFAKITHDLRTPLNHIIGFTEIVRDGKAGVVNENQREYLGDVVASGRLLLSLINDVLDTAKIESGTLSLNLQQVDPSELIDVTLRSIREEARQRGIEVRSTAAAHAIPLQADHLRIRQVLMNLASNAMKFTPAGGEVEIGAAAIGSGVEFHVRDTGHGISDEHADIVFEPFAQLEVSGNGVGTGLGLSIAKTLVDLHGGQIWVESDGPGTGSIFRFTIPNAHENEERTGA